MSFTDGVTRAAAKVCKQPGAAVMHIAWEPVLEAGGLRQQLREQRCDVLDLQAGRPLRCQTANEVTRLQRELRRVNTECDVQRIPAA